MWSSFVISLIAGGCWGAYAGSNNINLGYTFLGCLAIGFTSGPLTAALGLP